MTPPPVQSPTWPSMDGDEWQQRVRNAAAIGERWAFPDLSPEQESHYQELFGTFDQTAYVGTRHHTVPRFVLERWADKNGRVQIHRRVERQLGVQNIRDLAVRDFYTIIDVDGRKNSIIETLMGRLESAAKPHLDFILNPFTKPVPLTIEAIRTLVQYAAYQSVRTTRWRREIELQAEWFAKASAAGRIADEELQRYSIAPHQNDCIDLAMKSAEALIPYFMCRPLAVVQLNAPLLYMCDEPVVLNAPVGAFHTADCFLSDAEVEARMQRRSRKTKKRKRGRERDVRGRTLHFSSTRPSGHGVADEILLPISPSTVLLWGPLGSEPFVGPVEWISLDDMETDRFASMANQAMCHQALEWVVARISDDRFASREFIEPGPLMKVCDGRNAASLALNRTPSRFRPHRLWTPEPDEFLSADIAGTTREPASPPIPAHNFSAQHGLRPEDDQDD